MHPFPPPSGGVLVSLPAWLRIGPDAALYIADTGNNRVRRVGSDGRITTVAGNGRPEVLREPEAVALSKQGKLFIADSGNHRIRTVQVGRG
jgi:sugar lactone lactonase YvrE